MTVHFGMRGNGDWVDNQRPENWREMILYLYPNGDAPLTAILSMLSSESTDDPAFHWFTKSLPEQGGTATGVFTDAMLGSAATASQGFGAGSTVYVKVAEAVADEFREGHTAITGKGEDGDISYAYVGKVTDVIKNGTSSALGVRLLERASTTYPIVSIDRVDVSGNMNPEGATMPDAISYNPVEFFNYTQIFRTPLSITRTARKTRLRTGNGYQEAKREALELHALEMERAFMLGIRSSGTGSNGKPERSTYGVRKFIQENASENVVHYPTTAGFGGEAWVTANGGGERWLNEQLERIYRHGRTTKLGLIGSQALLAIQRLAQNTADINITPRTLAYGIQVQEWFTPFGSLMLKTHPLFNNSAAWRRSLLILEPERLRYRFVDDTFFVDDPQDRRNRNNSRDGTEEEYITEAGLEIHHPSTMGYLSGLGLAGTTST